MTPVTYEVTLKSSTPYGQSRAILTERESGESAADHEKRCWRERMHQTGTGHVFIPPMAFKNGLTSAAQYKAMKIPGARGKTFTKVFESGIFVQDRLVLDVKAADVPPELLFLPPDGKRGGGTRVWKYMPRIDEWSGSVQISVLASNTITKEIFATHFEAFGSFIGLGFFRPERNGYWGRFKVIDIQEVNE